MAADVDFVVAPCEQVTAKSGKKKRKRALKASSKHTQAMAKMEKRPMLMASVTMGEEAGVDSFDMREYIKTMIGGETEEAVQGYMVYGTDILETQKAFSDIKEFIGLTKKEKIRGMQGTGNPGKSIFQIIF